MAVFVAYSDETETSEEDSRFLMGGYVASETDWPYFVRAWQSRVLDGPPAIPYLHMTEIRDGEWQQAHGLSLQDANERISEAVRVIRSTGGISFVTSEMVKKDLKEVVQPALRRIDERIIPGVDVADYMCFLAFAEFTIAELHANRPEVERVNFFVSKKQKVTHHIRRFHEDLRQQMPEPYKKLVGDLYPGDMVLVLPLQAADVLCWYSQRILSERDDAEDRRQIRKIGQTTGYRHVYTREDMEQFAANLVININASKT